ncbi:MAG: sacsin N-terminal ATP-binding-like domain-containing protein, partial [Thermoplasmata archaeon]
MTQSAKDIINEIKEKIESMSKSTGESIDDLMKSGYNNLLKQIGPSLYPDKSHFVFELIQNADDNEYSTNETPMIKFEIYQDKIVVKNNENGFTEENVKKMCTNNSTKNEESGKIGNKGIGFKSVFGITNNPKIYSNGFQFEFKHDSNKDNYLDFITPYWLEGDVPSFVNKNLTNIILPLREGIDIDEVTKEINFAKNSLIFLHKLKKIIIDNKIKNEYQEISLSKNDKDDRKIEIQVSNKDGRTDSTHYYVIHYVIHVEKENTEVHLAFKLKKDGSADAGTQKVFAYLPIKDYGFKFIINANFILTTNRESIDEKNEQNVALRDNIVDAFISAINEFKNTQDDVLKKSFYNFIPNPKDISDDFFSPMCDSIINKLKEMECILTESNTWKKPSDIFLVSNENEKIRNIIKNEDLKDFFDKEYISSEINATKEILKKLGVEDFELEDLTKCLENEDWVKKHNDEWFGTLYDYLYDYLSKVKQDNEKKEKIEKLKKLKIIPLESNEIVSIENVNPVFFPLGENNNNYEFEKEELKVVKRSILNTKDKKKQENISNFTQILGVTKEDPNTIIEKHILPIEVSDKWKHKNIKILNEYIKYIKENLKSYIGPFDELKNLFINIKDNIYGHPQNMYISKDYGNENNLEDLFDGIQGVPFVSSTYIEDILKLKDEEKKRDEIKKWKDFFIKLGVNEGLKIDTVVIRGTDDINNMCYLKPDDRYKLRGTLCKDEKISDYKIEYLDDILSKIKKEKDEKKAKNLLLLLDRQWDNKYKSLEYEWVYYGKWRTNNNPDAQWLHDLKINEWLPTENGELAKPSDVFLGKKEIKNLLSDTVPYLSEKIIENDDLIQALGINTKPTIDDMKKSLERLAQTKNADKLIFENIYKKIYDEINNIYNSINIPIYIPGKDTQIPKNEVFWNDYSEYFGESHVYLTKYYSDDIKNFFIKYVKVPEKPSPRDYINLILLISSKDILSKNKDKLFKIYGKLNEYLEKNYRTLDEQWWNNLTKEDAIIKESAIIFVNKNKFWKNNENIFVNDDDELYDLFKDKEKIAFFNIPENNYHKFKYFIEATNIKYIS